MSARINGVWGRVAATVWLLLPLVAGGCQPRETAAPKPARSPEAAGKPLVMTVNYPLAYMAQRLAGDAVEVRFPAPPNVDPAFWRPDADQIRQYQQAALILDNGADYAQWMQTATLPESKLVNVSARLSDQLIRVEGQVQHTHGPSGPHAHQGLAFTLWLDPRIAMEQAARAADALRKLAPDRASDIDASLRALHSDLQSLDDQLDTALEPLRSEPWLASHPVYQYLARRYALNLTSVHFEPDATPTEAQWQELDALLREHPAQRMLWEDEPNSQTQDELQRRGIQVIVFRPCGNKPPSGDFLREMKQNVANIR